MSNLVQEKFEVVLSAGNGGNGAIKPFSTLNWGIFLLQQLGCTIMQNLIFPCDQSVRYAWVLLDTKCWDQYWIEILVPPRSLHILHFTQKTHQKVQLLIHLLWGSCEIPVFILPIKTILSELFCLGQALDCEWRDLKLETNFVLGNFYYLWKNSYIWKLESVIQNKLLLCSLTFFSFQTTSVIL